MNTGKVYFDSEGNECSIWQMVKREPTWAAVRIQEGEKAIDEMTTLRQQLAESEARAKSQHGDLFEIHRVTSAISEIEMEPADYSDSLTVRRVKEMAQLINMMSQQLADAKEENERVRQANLHTMDVFEDMKAAKEKAEARAAELIHNRQIEKTSMLMRVSRLSETLEAIRSGEFSLPKCQQLADRALGSPVTEAAILRLQAEAVEAAVRELMPGSSGAPDDPSPELNAACEVCADFRDYAQRLRQQADEAERAGGDHG